MTTTNKLQFDGTDTGTLAAKLLVRYAVPPPTITINRCVLYRSVTDDAPGQFVGGGAYAISAILADGDDDIRPLISGFLVMMAGSISIAPSSLQSSWRVISRLSGSADRL